MKNLSQEELVTKLFTGVFRGLHESAEEKLPVAKESRELIFRQCNSHGPRVSMYYKGPACPYCLALDDLELTQRGER